MLTKEQASALAAWVNEHDDGTPQPRAEEFAIKSPTGGFGVRIRSRVVYLDRTHSTETAIVYSVAEARSILGY